jgi:uncharacterized protein
MAEEKRKSSAEEPKGTMTVREAGHIGGEKTAETHGHEFYEEIGHKGGQRVRELIQEGKKVEGEEGTAGSESSSSRSRSSSSKGRGSEEETSRR